MRSLGWPTWQLVEGGAGADGHIMALVARTRIAKQDPLQTLQQQQPAPMAMYGFGLSCEQGQRLARGYRRLSCEWAYVWQKAENADDTTTGSGQDLQIQGAQVKTCDHHLLTAQAPEDPWRL